MSVHPEAIAAVQLLPAQRVAQLCTSAHPWHTPSVDQRHPQSIAQPHHTRFPVKKPNCWAAYQGLPKRCCWPDLPLEKLSSPEQVPTMRVSHHR